MQVAAALVTVLALASWQFSRALDKMALRDARLQRLGTEPIPDTAFVAGIADFTRLSLSGRYDPKRQFFVASRPGERMQVVTPFVTAAGVFLVNRGWVRRDGMAATLPTPGDLVSVVGVVWPTTPLSPMFAQTPWPDGWPKQVRGLDPARMANAVARDHAAQNGPAGAPNVHEVEVRLEHGSPGVFHAAPLAWDYSPGTHWGYVVQWLLIGAALGVGYIIIGKRRAREQPA